MKIIHKILLLLFLASSATFICPALNDTIESRPVTGIYSLEIGKKNVLATYLSPLHYTGTDVGISGAWSKAMPFNPKKAVMSFDASVNFSNLLNPAETA